MPDRISPKYEQVTLDRLRKQRVAAQQQEGLLYHYTGFGGLYGIFKNQSLYFSDAECLNDARERVHVQHVIDQLIQAERKTHQQDVYAMAFLDQLSEMNWMLDIQYFIASFSRAADHLGQWRGYGGPGVAYCIVFKEKQLVGETKALISGASVTADDVEYELQRQSSVVAPEIRLNAFLEEVRQQPGMSVAEHMNRTGLDRADNINIWMQHSLQPLLFKDPAFKDENEFRIVIRGVPSKNVEPGAREGSSFVKQHIELKYERSVFSSFVDHVTVGPGPTPLLAVRKASQLMQQLGFHDVPCFPSDVPYRP